MKKKLPIGIDGFEKIRTNDFYYIDKTRFIAELLHNWGEVNLFTRPRRFGKTLNMSMLKCFFEIGSNRALFDGLQIAHEKELCQQYQGQFPVLFLSLKSVDGLTFEAAEAALRTVVGSEAGRFRFLKDSDQLTAEEKSLYEQLIETGTSQGGIFAMSGEALAASLKTLSMLLAKHYGRKVIILIDEYDVPLDKAFQAGYYDEMVSLLRSLFGNALKTNDSLQFAILTGCLRTSKESIFTGLNNLKVHTISDMRYDEYFGFTDADVDVLLADPDAEPENYWANTSGNGIIRRLLQKADQTTREEVERLLSGESIVKTVRQELTYRDIEDSIDNIWSVLYSTGYLTQTARLPGKQMKLALPNREVRELFADLVKDWFRETTRADTSRINRFCQAFPAGDAATIQSMLQDYLWDSISVRDTAVRTNRKENFYHGMLLGLLQSQESWSVRSNEENGIGYSDIAVATPERIGIVIELKYADDGNLDKSCAEALAQIEAKQDAEGLRRRGMKKS